MIVQHRVSDGPVTTLYCHHTYTVLTAERRRGGWRGKGEGEGRGRGRGAKKERWEGRVAEDERGGAKRGQRGGRRGRGTRDYYIGEGRGGEGRGRDGEGYRGTRRQEDCALHCVIPGGVAYSGGDKENFSG